jgi:4-alpha-glucanotransferase
MQTKLLLGLHSHQPIDNFDHVVYEAIEKSYKPFFETVKNDDWLKFSLHISGWLFEFIKTNDKELFALIKSCYDKGMIEFFSGGFYEPILAAIPKRDRILQIKKMNRFLLNNFGAKPRGLWLTERVWSESIVESLTELGIEYILTDDYHFVAAGYDENSLNGHFITEEGGDRLGVFPISKQLRYLIPFKKASSAIAELESEARLGKAAVIFDDGEKFGLWPHTYEWVYEKGWLREFLDGIKGSDKIECMHFSDYFDSEKPLGLAYLPEVSYYEMGEWSLNPNDAALIESVKHHTASSFGAVNADKFVKGGIWKNFFSKYEEANRIHKKTLRLSSYAKKINSELFDEMLLKTEANDALWHGVFGGVYLPNLRDNCYKHIIECEKKLGLAASVEISDENFDGYSEARLKNDRFVALFEEKNGAQMSDFSSFDALFNYQNTLTRRKEAYHQKFFENKEAPKEATDEGIDTIHNITIEGAELLRENLFYDWYQKNSFIEHITDDSFDLHSFFACSFKEYGDFANQPFTLKKHDKKSVEFERDGGIYLLGNKHDTKITKKFSINDDSLIFDISLDDDSEASFVFAEEFNLHFCDYDELLINGKKFANTHLALDGIKHLSIKDGIGKKEIYFELDAACNALVVPTITVSQNEKGAELCTQGISIAFLANFAKKFSFCGKLSMKDI